VVEPLLEEDRACIVTSDEPLPAGALPARGAVVTAHDLRLGPGAAGELLGREAPRLPAAAARRVASLCQGAAATLVAVCGPRPSSARPWSPGPPTGPAGSSWPPDFERLVLTEGDGNAIHIGRKSELGLTGIQIAPTPSGEDEWRRWLRDNGIDWDGEVA
jgi:hypothetical protein